MLQKARSVQLAWEARKVGEGETSPEVVRKSGIRHCGGDGGGRASAKEEIVGGEDATGPACRNYFPAGSPVDRVGAAGAPVRRAGHGDFYWRKPRGDWGQCAG